MVDYMVEAEMLYHAGAYAEAGALFHDLWDQGHTDAGCVTRPVCARRGTPRRR